MRKLLTRVRNQFQHQELVILFIILALAVLRFPLQKYMTLARFQHYGIALYVLSLGFFLQSIWSWKRLRAWARALLVCSGAYMASFGLLMYSNPWLDTRVALMTADQDEMRQLYSILCAAGGLVLGTVWWQWLLDEHRLAEHRRQDEKESLEDQ